MTNMPTYIRALYWRFSLSYVKEGTYLLKYCLLWMCVHTFFSAMEYDKMKYFVNYNSESKSTIQCVTLRSSTELSWFASVSNSLCSSLISFIEAHRSRYVYRIRFGSSQLMPLRSLVATPPSPHGASALRGGGSGRSGRLVSRIGCTWGESGRAL